MMLSVGIPLYFALTWRLLYASSGTIEIERHNISYTGEKWSFQPDTFKIPSEMCSSDISSYCEAMGGHSVGGCECECNSAKTTFGFYDGQWNCTANSRVRHHGECSLILLDGRTQDSALITVPLNLQADIRYLMPTDLKRCYIIPFKSTYLRCNGLREKLDDDFINNFINKRFKMVGERDPQFFNLKNTTWDPKHKDFKGRILRITIGCYNGSNAIIPNCLLLKMQGTMKCPQFSLPSLPKPSTSPSTISHTSETEISTPKIPPRISTLKPTTVVLSTAELPQTISLATTLKPTTTRSSSTVLGNNGKNAADENHGGNTGLIVGVAVGVTCLTLIIVAIVIIKRRRTKRNAASAKSNKTVENVGYELGVDNSLKINDHRDQDEYSYAYADAIPLGRMRNISKNDRPENQGPQPTVSNHMYGQHDPPSQTTAAPDYAEINNKPKNKVKNPLNSNGPSCKRKEGNQSEEPFYDVLEDSGFSNGSTGESEPPCYHVLEGPFSEGTPYYSVLEKPPSNEPPEYRSLDGPNPGVYKVLNRDTTKRPVKQNPNYNDTVYDSVGDVINDTTDIYQKLDQHGQMNLDAYQTLNNGDMQNHYDLTSHSNA